MAAVRALDRLSRPLPGNSRPHRQAGCHHRRRRLHRHQPGRPAGSARASGSSSTTTWRARASRQNIALAQGQRTATPCTFEIADIRDPYVAARCGGPRGRACLPFRGPGRGHHQSRGPDHRLRGQRRAARSTCWRRSGAAAEPPPLVFTSTNKVYGKLADVELERTASRYAPADRAIARASGIGETPAARLLQPLRLLQGQRPISTCWIIARIYDLPAAVFRMSCIYGPHQFGTEDQGWVAHFLRPARSHDQPITIYGDGQQVRDILFVDDLVDAFLLAADPHAGDHGPAPSTSAAARAMPSACVELLDRIERARRPPAPSQLRAVARRAISATTCPTPAPSRAATGWRPRVGSQTGLARLLATGLAAAERGRRAAPRSARACA